MIGKKVLVTGGSGFIGRQSIPMLLERGFEVHLADLRDWRQLPGAVSAPRVIYHPVNLMDFDAVSRLVSLIKPEYLLHFAWYSVPVKYWTAPENLDWVQASLTLLRSFAINGGRRVVMAGSCAEYDWNYAHLSENNTPIKPAQLYGVCKNALQQMLSAYTMKNEMSSAWGRVFFLFGPHEYPERVVAYVIRSILQGEVARCTDGGQIRDFLYVKDVASAFVKLLESDVKGAVNIASGKPTALKDVLSLAASILKRPDLLELGALTLPENDPPSLVANVQRLQDEVGWVPKYDLQQGMVETIGWWKTQMNA
jgi:nucleoside-diphosphate-sugar epimerase